MTNTFIITDTNKLEIEFAINKYFKKAKDFKYNMRGFGNAVGYIEFYYKSNTISPIKEFKSSIFKFERQEAVMGGKKDMIYTRYSIIKN